MARIKLSANECALGPSPKATKEYLKVYGVLVGKKPLVFTNNDSGYETAIEFKKHGVEPIVLDSRSNPQSEIIDEAKNLGIYIKNSYSYKY